MAKTRLAGKPPPGPAKKSASASTTKPDSPSLPSAKQPQDIPPSSQRGSIPQAAPQPRPIHIKTTSKTSSSSRPATTSKPPNKLGMGLYSIAKADQELSASSPSKRLTIRPKNLPNPREQQDPPVARLGNALEQRHTSNHPSSSEIPDQATNSISRPSGPRSKIKPLLPTALNDNAIARKSDNKGKEKVSRKREVPEEAVVSDGPESDGEWDMYRGWVPSQKPVMQSEAVVQEEGVGAAREESPAESTEEEEERIEDKNAVPASSGCHTLTPTPTLSLPIPQPPALEFPAASNGLYPRQYIPPSPAPTTPSPEDTALAALLDSHPLRDFQRISQARPADFDPIERPENRPGRRHSAGTSPVEPLGRVETEEERSGTNADEKADREEQEHKDDQVRKVSEKRIRDRAGAVIPCSPGDRRGSGGAVSYLAGVRGCTKRSNPISNRKGKDRATASEDEGDDRMDDHFTDVREEDAECATETADVSSGDEQDPALLLTPSAMQRDLLQRLDADENKRRYGSPVLQPAHGPQLSDDDLPTSSKATTRQHIFIQPARNALKTPMTYGNKVNRFIPVPAAPRRVAATTGSEVGRTAPRTRRAKVQSSPTKSRCAPVRRPSCKQGEEKGKETEGQQVVMRRRKHRESSRGLSSQRSDASEDPFEEQEVAKDGSDPRIPSASRFPASSIRSLDPSRRRHQTTNSRSSFRLAPMSNRRAQLIADEEDSSDGEASAEADAADEHDEEDEWAAEAESSVKQCEAFAREAAISARIPSLNVDIVPEGTSNTSRTGEKFGATSLENDKDEDVAEEVKVHVGSKSRARHSRRRRPRHDPDEPTQPVELSEPDPIPITTQRDDAGPLPSTAATPFPSTNPREAYQPDNNPYAGFAQWQGAQDRQLSSKRQEEEDAKAARRAQRKEAKKELRRAEVQREKDRIAAEMAENLGFARKGDEGKRMTKRRLFVVSDTESEEGTQSEEEWDALRPNADGEGAKAQRPRKQARGRPKVRPQYEVFFNADDDDVWRQDGHDGAYRKTGPQDDSVQLTRLADPAESVRQDSSYWATRKAEKRADKLRKMKRRKREHSPYEGVMLDMTAAHSAAGRVEEWAQKVQTRAPPRRKIRQHISPNRQNVRKRSNSTRGERYLHIHPVRQIDRISWDEHNARFDAARAFPVDTRLFQATVNGQRQAMYEIRSRKRAQRAQGAYLRPAESFPSMGSLDEVVQTAAPTQYTTQTRTGAGGAGSGSGHTMSSRGRMAGAPRLPKLFFTSREPTPGRLVSAKSPKTARSALTFSTGSKGDLRDEEEDEMVPPEWRDDGENVPKLPPALPRAPLRAAASDMPREIPVLDKGKGPARAAVARDEEEDDFFDNINVPPSAPVPAEGPILDAGAPKLAAADNEAATACDKAPPVVKEATTPKTHMMNGLLLTDTMMDQLQWIKDISLDAMAGGAGPSTSGEAQQDSVGAGKKRKKPSGRRGGKIAAAAGSQPNATMGTLDTWLHPADHVPPQAEAPKALTSPAAPTSHPRTPKTPAKRKSTETSNLQAIKTPAKRAKWEQLLHEWESKNADDVGSSPRVQAITQPSSPVRNVPIRNADTSNTESRSRPIDPVTPTASRRRAPSIPAARVGLSRTQTRTTLLKQAPTYIQGGQAGHAMLAGRSYPTIMAGQMMSSSVAPTHVSGATAKHDRYDYAQEEEEDIFGETSKFALGSDLDYDSIYAQMAPATAMTSRTARSRSRVTSGADMSTTQRNTDSARDDIEYDETADQHVPRDNDTDRHARAHGGMDMYGNDYDLGGATPFIYNDPQDVNARYDQMYPHDPTMSRGHQAGSAVPVSRQLRRIPQHQHHDATAYRYDHQDSAKLRTAANVPADRRHQMDHQDAHQAPSHQQPGSTTPHYTQRRGGQELQDRSSDDTEPGPSTHGPTFHTTVAPAPIASKRKIGKSKSTFIPPRQLVPGPARSAETSLESQSGPVAQPTSKRSNTTVPRAPKRMGSCSQKAAAQYRPLTIAGQAH